ncbi:MAG: hypothetical protein ACU4F9_11600 [Arcticibacter sp.]
MTVKQLVLIILMAIVVGITAEYLLRLIGVANLGGTVGGAVGIIAAMILNKKKEKKNEVSSKKSKNR